MVDLVAEAAAYMETEQPYDSSDAEQVNKARQKSSRKRAAELRMVRTMMETPEGRRYWYNFMDRCGTFTAPAHDNAHLDAKAIGRQQAGHWILQDVMDAASDFFGMMIKENKRID